MQQSYTLLILSILLQYSSQETIFSIIISRVHRRLQRPNDSAAANRRRTTGRLTPSAACVAASGGRLN